MWTPARPSRKTANAGAGGMLMLTVKRHCMEAPSHRPYHSFQGVLLQSYKCILTCVPTAAVTMADLHASVANIKPSVSRSQVKRYEDWEAQFAAT